MDELYDCLETKIQLLLTERDALKKANSELHLMNSKLVAEGKTLFSRHQAAITTLRMIISELNSVECSYDSTSNRHDG